jgi:response regulator RpfG family c-di-GMP phosphodiesterase
MDSARHHTSIPSPSQKPRLLIVDDEPDNLDLLYRTFRRDFQVLRADSGMSALQVLATEGEVAVIISDQRMPDMKGTEFLSKTVPQFPNTVRIILTGFTDVGDLVEAINSGQVYQYITKPWEPNELKAIVQKAADTYEQSKQRAAALRLAQIQAALLNAIFGAAREATSVKAVLEAIAIAFEQSFAVDCTLQLVDETELANTNLSDPASSPALHTAAESVTEITQIAFPIAFQDEVLATLLLQWQYPVNLKAEEWAVLHLAVQQVALALTSTRFRLPSK